MCLLDVLGFEFVYLFFDLCVFSFFFIYLQNVYRLFDYLLNFGYLFISLLSCLFIYSNARRQSSVHYRVVYLSIFAVYKCTFFLIVVKDLYNFYLLLMNLRTDNNM